MTRLTTEQQEQLRVACIDGPYRVMAVVEVMLDQVRAEAWDEGWTAGCNDQQYGNEDAEPWTPNPHRPSEATERPVSGAEGSGGTTGPLDAERPADRRTAPLLNVPCIHGVVATVQRCPWCGPECGARTADRRMVCQLRRGHDGAHEDWRQV